MPYKQFPQLSFFSPELADPDSLLEGTVGWLLRYHAAALFPAWLFVKWAGAGRRGRKGWPVSVLLTALILSSREGETRRRAMVRRLKRDTSWRAACGLEIGGETPDEATFRRFEKVLRHRDGSSGVPRITLLHEHIVRLCVSDGVVGDRAVWAMDSTPMWCFGAVHGTFRLLGDGLRSLSRRVARWTGRTLDQLAAEWELPLLLAKSTKGYFRIDWRDADARANATDELVGAVLVAIERVRSLLPEMRSNQQKKARKACRQLAKVIRDDLETDAKGRLVVAQRVTADRVVSITDSEARSSRKSKSQAYKGFKVLGDTAYSGAELRVMARELEGVDILAPPQTIPDRPGRFARTDFDIDVSGGTAICPAGIAVGLRQTPKSRWFAWPRTTCKHCELRPQCLTPKTPYKTLPINPHYEEINEIRERWNDPAVREEYRQRSQCERLVNEAVRRGCRSAKAWGLQAAEQQAYVAALGNNLALLAKVLAKKEDCALAA